VGFSYSNTMKPNPYKGFEPEIQVEMLEESIQDDKKDLKHLNIKERNGGLTKKEAKYKLWLINDIISLENNKRAVKFDKRDIADIPNDELDSYFS
jgi:hypothetical protein